MEDDDEIHSHASPTPNGRIAVTVAAPPPPPPPNSLTLALPIQPHQKPFPSGGGREDCWSEGATAVLIGAWGERYLELSRGNLKQKHWKDVADIVSSQEDRAKIPKTDIQCKNRIDTVKKKYKAEKSKIAAGGGPSKWRFYDRLDELIGPTAKMNSTPPSSSAIDANKVPMGIPFGVTQSHQKKPSSKRPPAVDSDDDESGPENSMDSSDGLPPETARKRPRIQSMTNTKISDGNWGNSVRELTRAVLKFGEAYQQAETAKLQQLVEMEKQRMKFAKDLELQRMQYFMKTQLELSQPKIRRTGSDSNNPRGISKNIDANNDNNNNSDSNN